MGSSYAVLIFLRDQGGLQTVQSFALTVAAGVLTNDFDLISVRAAGAGSGSGASLNPVLSTNGQFVAFVSDATNLVAGDLNGRRDVFWRDRGAGVTRLVSRSLSGTSGNGESESPSISPDGRYVAFHSRATNLAAGDTNANYDVFVWDSQTDTVTLVSRTAAGRSGAGDSFAPKLSANGRLVAFLSTAGDLAGPDTNNTSDVFLFNLDTSVMTLVSVNLNLTSGNGSCGVPVMSADGRHVAFLSRASDLVTNDFNTLNDVFVRDLQSGVTRLVSVNAAGTGSGNRLSLDPVISADGRFIAFGSQATDLVALPDTNNFPDVFLRDMQLEVTRLVSVNRLGTAAGGTGGAGSVLPASFNPFLSADGTKVLFSSLAEDLVAGDTNRAQDVFLYDVAGQTNALISLNKFGTGAGNGASGVTPQSLSADGRYVAFFSDASDIGAADLNGRTDVFLRDLLTQSTKIISRARVGGLAGNGNSYQPAMSADGATVLFTSEASILVPNDSNQATDIFTAASALAEPEFSSVNLALGVAALSAQTVGTTFNVVLAATNLSANPATGVRVALNLPGALTVTSASPSQGSVNAGGTDWQLGDLAAGATASLTLTVNPLSLGIAPLSASVSRIDQPDTEVGNNSLTTAINIDRTAAGAVFHLPGGTAYLSRTNSPFFAGLLSGAFTLENFERGGFEVQGVTATAGAVSPPGATTDSVDADDGTVEGSGTAGRSFLVASTNAVTFSFDPLRLGRLPTKVGIVLTDGNNAGAGIEAYDLNGVSLGVMGPFAIGDLDSTGETAEDRFLGAEFAGGISALRVYYPTLGFELDHLQFDVPTTDLALSGVVPTNATFGSGFTVTLTVTNRGPVAATGVIVTNADPGSEVTFLGAVGSQGTVDAQGTWSVGSLAVGGSASLSATVVSAGGGFLLFRAGVRSALPDAHVGNDTVNLGVLVTNTAPSLVFATNTLTLPEDLPALSYPAFFRGHAPESNQFITNLSVSVDNPALFSVGPALQTNGLLTLALAPNATGTATVSVLATDNGGTLSGGVATGSNFFTIVVTPVNDAPSFALATTSISVLEDSGSFTYPALATGISAGPPDEAGQAVAFAVTASSNGLFSVLPAVAANGSLSFTPAANAVGTALLTIVATDNGGTANGGINSATQLLAVAIGVQPVNDAPIFTLATNSVVVLEDAGLVTMTNFIADLSPGPADEAGQRVTNFVVTTTAAALFAVLPAVDTNGTLTFTPAANSNGVATVTVQALDDGGTANGGTNGSSATNFTITITPVNQPPTFTLNIFSIGVAEDVGLTTFSNLVSGLSLGPLDEIGQTLLGYTVTNASPGLFAVQPAVDVNGTLTFRGATNATGTVLVSVVAQDSGGTAGGGNDRSVQQTFFIILQEQNDAPSFTFATNLVTVLEDAGPVTVSGFIASSSVGPGQEIGGQNITNYAVAASDGSLFSVAPAIGTNGVLTFTPAANANGTTTVTVVARDNGGTGNGGQQDSAPQNFTVTLTPVNDAPTLSFATNLVVVLEDAGAQTLAGFALGAAVEAGQSVTNYAVSAVNAGLFAVAPAIAANGTLTFTPATSANGSTTVTVVAQDDGGTASGGVDKATNTFTLTITPVNDAPSFTLTNFPATDGVQEWVRSATANDSTGLKVVTDNAGNVIVAGDETIPSEVTTYRVHLVKYSNAGVAQWTNLISGEGLDDSVRTRGVAVDSAGAVIFTGMHSGLSASSTDFLTMKFSAGGSLVWSNRFDGLGNDEPMAVVVDGSDKVIVTGKSVDISSEVSYTDYLTLKYLADGTPFWTNRSSYAGPAHDVPRSVAVDAAGDVYVAGDGSNTDYTYAYTLKLAAATGVPVWTNQFDLGGENSTAEAVRVDSSGNVIVAGTLNNSSGQSFFGVVKYNGAGTVVWTNIYARNTEPGHVHGLVVDANGDPIITGNTEVAGNMDFTTIKYLANGTPMWTNHYGGPALGRDHPNAIAVNAAGEVFVTGDSAGNNSQDWATVKYTAAGVGVWTNRYDGTGGGNDIPNGIAVDNATNVFITGRADSVIRTIKHTALSGASQVVTNDVGTVTVTGFVTSSSSGPANESAQMVSFLVATDNASLFSVLPAIAANGTLTYRIAPTGDGGVAVVSVTAQDDGGTASGGTNASAVQTFTLIVLPVAVSPQQPAGLAGATLPPIVAQAVGSERMLRWLGTAGQYALESAASITGPWTIERAPLAQEIGDTVVRLPASTGTRFYRLIRLGPPRTDHNYIK